MTDGLLAWISVGINTSANYYDDIIPDAYYHGSAGDSYANPSWGPPSLNGTGPDGFTYLNSSTTSGGTSATITIGPSAIATVSIAGARRAMGGVLEWFM